MDQARLVSIGGDASWEEMMSDRYYVNDKEQANRDHEVHKLGCYWLSQAQSTRDLGYHETCSSAVRAAKNIYPQSNGCAFCIPACHTS